MSRESDETWVMLEIIDLISTITTLLLEEQRFEVAAASYDTKDHHSRPFDSTQQDVLAYRETAYAGAKIVTRPPGSRIRIQ